MFDKLITNLKAKAIAGQHWLNFAIRCAASCILFSVYPHYLVLIYLGYNGFFSYDLFHDGESGIHAVLGYSFIFLVLLGFFCLLPVFAVLDLNERRKSRDQATVGVEVRSAVREVRFSIAMLILVTLLLGMIVGLFYWTHSSRLLALVAFVAVVYVGVGFAAFKVTDTLRYVVVLCLGYGVLLVLPLYASSLVSGLVGFGLDRFGLGGGNATITVSLVEHSQQVPVRGRLILLSPEQIFLLADSDGRKVVIPRTMAVIVYDLQTKVSPAEQAHGGSKDGVYPGGDRIHRESPDQTGENEDGRGFKWLWSPKDYFYTSIGALLGAGAGLGFASVVEARKGRRLRARLLAAIVMSLEFNRDRAVQAKETLVDKGWPSFPLDGARLAGLVAEAHGMVTESVLRELDWHRFQLDHITLKIEVAATGYVTKAAAGDEATAGYQTSLRESLIKHCDEVIKGTGRLIGAVQAEQL